MKWFVAKLIFRICNVGRPQFDEHLRLISAMNAEEALLKSRLIGISEEDSFLNENNETVKWEFVNVADLRPLDKLKDGAELYSCIREHDEHECISYVRSVHQRAYEMQISEISSN